MATGNIPKLSAIIQVKRDNRPFAFRCFHGFDDYLRRRCRERRENTTRMEPAHTAAEYFFPIKIALLQLRGGLVAAVIKHHWRPDALASVAIHGSHVWAMHAIMFKMFIKWFQSHGFYPFRDQIADGIVDHGRGHACSQPKAIS